MIQKELFCMQDLNYKAFHSKLMPTISPDKIIGIRVPQLRAFSKTFFNSNAMPLFLNTLPHTYYEEDNVHAFLIEQIKDFNLCIEKTEAFLPYIDNWATCDMFRPKIFAQNTKKLLPYAYKWLDSDHLYTVRYGIGMFLCYFSDDKFIPEYAQKISEIHSNEYYINMMIAWYFASLLDKHYNIALTYLAQNKLSKWVHNKTIQKAVESHRISKETKDYLKTLKIK